MSALDELRENLREAAARDIAAERGAPPPAPARDRSARARADRRQRGGGRRRPDLGRRAGRSTRVDPGPTATRPPPGALELRSLHGRRRRSPLAARPRRSTRPRTASCACSSGSLRGYTLGAIAGRRLRPYPYPRPTCAAPCGQPARPGLYGRRSSSAACTTRGSSASTRRGQATAVVAASAPPATSSRASPNGRVPRPSSTAAKQPPIPTGQRPVAD